MAPVVASRMAERNFGFGWAPAICSGDWPSRKSRTRVSRKDAPTNHLPQTAAVANKVRIQAIAQADAGLEGFVVLLELVTQLLLQPVGHVAGAQVKGGAQPGEGGCIALVALAFHAQQGLDG